MQIMAGPTTCGDSSNSIARTRVVGPCPFDRPVARCPEENQVQTVFLLMSMVGGQFTETHLQDLKPSAATTPIIVELEGDEPDRAFMMVGRRRRAAVTSRANLQLKKLWKIASEVLGAATSSGEANCSSKRIIGLAP